jgi:hypothetical protein
MVDLIGFDYDSGSGTKVMLVVPAERESGSGWSVHLSLSVLCPRVRALVLVLASQNTTQTRKIQHTNQFISLPLFFYSAHPRAVHFGARTPARWDIYITAHPALKPGVISLMLRSLGQLPLTGPAAAHKTHPR